MKDYHYYAILFIFTLSSFTIILLDEKTIESNCFDINSLRSFTIDNATDCPHKAYSYFLHSNQIITRKIGSHQYQEIVSFTI